MLAAATTLALAACGSDPPHTGPRVEIDTIGDTTIVRTLSGSVWAAGARLVPEVSIGELDGPDEYLFGRIGSLAVDGEGNIYVFDTQASHVRVFNANGTYLATLGREGEGPGEFKRAEAIAVLPGGRLLVRDPGNMRVQVFDPESGETDEWEYNSGNTYRAGSPLYTDVRGRTFLLTSDQDWDDIILVLGPDGTHLDTLPEPTTDYEPVVVSAATENASVTSFVPFTPGFYWAVHSSGHFLTGLSSDYRVDLVRDDGVLRIERAYDPVPVSGEERDYRRESLVRMVRFTVPDWSWDGPAIPDHKPVFNELLTGRDGRIWVRLATAGQRVENESHDPEDRFSQPVTWEESTRYDVFEPDGSYLGVVAPPDGFRSHPDPVFDGDHVWAVATDELGVERVVRYRIEVDYRGGGRFPSETSFAGRLPSESRVAMLPAAWTMRQGGR